MLIKQNHHIRILSFNIHKGVSFLFRGMVLPELKAFIREADADIVFLQEVIGNNKNVPDHLKVNYDSQFEFLADEIWDHYSYSQNASYESGHHGNAILSKFPIKESFKIDISTNRWEQRGLLFSTMEIPANHFDHLEDPVTINGLCVHLNLFHFGRVKQYSMIEKCLKEHTDKDSKLILAGDFNDWNQKAFEHLNYDHLLKECHKSIHHSYGKTFPFFLPMIPLDRIYVKNLNPTNSMVLKHSSLKLSDHLPLLVDIKL